MKKRDGERGWVGQRGASAWVLGSVLALATGCASIQIPVPRQPLAADASTEAKGEHYRRHSITGLGASTFDVDGREVLNGFLVPYMEQSGNSPAARQAKRALWAEGASGVLAALAIFQPAFAQMSLAPDSVYAIGALGIFTLAAWVDAALVQEQRQVAINNFNADLREELGLLAEEPLVARPSSPRAGWSYALSTGYRSTGAESLNRYVNAPVWELRTYRHPAVLLGAAWQHRSGLGMILNLDAVTAAHDAKYTNGRKQEFFLNSFEAVLGPSLLIPFGRRSRLSATLSAGAGLGWLFMKNETRETNGVILGTERVRARAPVAAAKVRLRTAGFPDWLALGLDMGYRWARYDSVGLHERQGLIPGAPPGKTWTGQDQSWDLSGFQMGIAIEFGSIPWGSK